MNVTPYKLVLVDNCSEENEPKRISRSFNKHVRDLNFQWSYLQLEENKGFSGGNNMELNIY